MPQKKKHDDLKYKRDNPQLPQTAKSYCDNWIKEQIFNRKAEFSSKYTEKGNIVEDNSLDYIAEQLDFGMLFKNDEYFEDEYKTGTPDVILPKLIIDAKNPWSWETFPVLETEIPNSDYFYQGQVYMSLTTRRAYKLIYVLSDTPDHLIVKEALWYCRNNGYEELQEDVLKDFHSKMTYGDVDDKYKIKVFDIEYDPKAVQDINWRVKACRKYIVEKIKELKL